MKKSLLLFALLSFTILSCNKDSLIENQELHQDAFFIDDYISTTNPNVIPYSELSARSDKKEKLKQQVKEFYKLNPNKKDILKNNLGHVMWDKFTLTEFEDYNLGVFPIAKQNSYFTEGILMVTFNKSKEVLNIAVDKRNKLGHLPIIVDKEYPNNEVDLILIVSKFLTFDKTVFEYSDCDLVSKLDPYKNSGQQSHEIQTRACELVMYTHETVWFVCVGSEGSENAYCYNAGSTYTYTYEEYCTSGGGVPSGGSGPGGGGPSGPGNEPGIITNTLTINIDEHSYQIVNGILQVLSIPKISTQNSSQQEIFNHMIEVIRAMNKFFCLNGYYPIDWADYIDGIYPFQFSNLNWRNCSNIVLDFTNNLYGNYRTKMEPDPIINNPIGNNRHTLAYPFYNTNVSMFQISFPSSCDELTDYIKLDGC